jgi:hypothetical protein
VSAPSPAPIDAATATARKKRRARGSGWTAVGGCGYGPAMAHQSPWRWKEREKNQGERPRDRQWSNAPAQLPFHILVMILSAAAVTHADLAAPASHHDRRSRGGMLTGSRWSMADGPHTVELDRGMCALEQPEALSGGATTTVAGVQEMALAAQRGRKDWQMGWGAGVVG